MLARRDSTCWRHQHLQLQKQVELQRQRQLHGRYEGSTIDSILGGFKKRDSTCWRGGIHRVGESDIVAPATGDPSDGCKTTERHATDSAEHAR